MLIAGTPEFMFFCLVLMRMSGFVLLNPVLGRRNIPGIFRVALVFMLSVVIYLAENTGDVTEFVENINTLEFGFLLIKEFACGYILGFVMVLFEFILTNAGFIIDFQMGLSMATVYDPQNGAQIAVTGQMLQIYYMLIFFAVDGHLALMKILLTSADVVPYGAIVIGSQQANALVTLFVECVVLSIKLAFPVIAIEFLLEMAVGMLIKIIPQVNLFVLNLELKIVLGILILLLLISPIGEFMQDIISDMLSEMQEILRTMAG